MKQWIAILAVCMLGACQKKPDIDIPCQGVPCSQNDNPMRPDLTFNQVGGNARYRQGTWVNISASALSSDTIIFHNDTLWSYINSAYSASDIDSGRYEFRGTKLCSLTDFDGSSVPFHEGALEAINEPCFVELDMLYDDSTGILAVHRLFNALGGYREFYIKIE